MEVSLHYSASGKLLLWGEYLVLKGALSLAIPLAQGQTLQVNSNSTKSIFWKSYEQENLWFEAEFDLDLGLIKSSDVEKAKQMQALLQLIKNQQPQLFASGFDLEFNLDFNPQFGFGSSSTLIVLLSQWSGIDAYYLLENTWGGSAYDIAAATATQAFVYDIKQKISRTFSIPESIAQHLLFVYLGQKQNSAKAVVDFKSKTITATQIQKMNQIVEAASTCTNIQEWEDLMQESESFLAEILNTKTVKAQHFADYPYAIKSLGAWGGDFVMATCRNLEAGRQYFLQKQKTPVYTYQELIKK